MSSKKLIVLGLESTAHTFGCGVATSDGEILSNVNSEYIPPQGGIHPREAAQHHARVALESVIPKSVIRESSSSNKINIFVKITRDVIIGKVIFVNIMSEIKT